MFHCLLVLHLVLVTYQVVIMSVLVMVMTVEPGYGGQKLIDTTIPKISKLKTYIEENKSDNEDESLSFFFRNYFTEKPVLENAFETTAMYIGKRIDVRTGMESELFLKLEATISKKDLSKIIGIEVK